MRDTDFGVMESIDTSALTEEQLRELAIEQANEKIEAIKDFEGLKIELIGYFVWVDGNTKENKENLKMLGFQWYPKKLKWYWRSPIMSGYSKHTHMSHRRIVAKYGVQRSVTGADPTPEEE